MQFVVKRCVRDYDEVWKTELAAFDTEAEAFADNENRAAFFNDVWYEIDWE